MTKTSIFPKLTALFLLLFLMMGTAATVSLVPSQAAGTIIITGILDGDLSGGTPKAIELYAAGSVDMSTFSLWRSANGTTFTDTGASLSGTYADEFVYLIGSDNNGETAFNSVFGSSGDYANRAYVGTKVSGNGNDGFQIRSADGLTVIDQVWENNVTDSYKDSYWYRNNETGPDGGWTASNWSAGGNGALDGLDAAGHRAAVPFGSYIPAGGVTGSWTLQKSAPLQVAANSAFTYTLTLANNTGITLTTIALSDTLPANVDFIRASDSGVSNGGGLVSWTVSSLPDGNTLTRTFAVTAPNGYGVNIVNSVYTATASNWLTPTTGAPVTSTTALPVTVNKTGPVSALNGTPMTYTLSVYNGAGATLNNVRISDALTRAAGFLSASGSYTLAYAADGWTIVWNLGSLNSGQSVSRTLSVLAPLYPGTLSNDDYSVQASNWATKSVGLPVETTITADSGNGCDTIPKLQGHGGESPCLGDRTVEGCITGVGAKGFYMQDLAGDGDPYTSDGVYVYIYSAWENPDGRYVGEEVRVSGGLKEYYGMTEFDVFDDDVTHLGNCAIPAPVDIAPLASPYQNPEPLFERFEGMRAQFNNLDGFAESGTTRYASRFTYGDPEIPYVPYSFIQNQLLLNHPRVFQDDYPGYGGLMYLSGAFNQNLPDVQFGDRMTAPALTGVLGYHFDKFQLIVDAPVTETIVVTENASLPVSNSVAPLGADQFGVCTFNLENLFDAVDDSDGDMGDWSPADAAEFDLWIDKRAAAIVEQIQACTVIATQEVEGKDPVWQAVVDAVNAKLGEPGRFAFDYYEPMDFRDISVGIFYDTNLTTLISSTQRQGCSTTNYSINYGNAQNTYGRVIPNPCTGGEYPIFNRPPYVGHLRLNISQPQTVTVIVNHFKSKRGEESTNLPRRIKQAEWVAELAKEYYADNGVIALGDMNDYLTSDPIQTLNDYDLGGGERLINVMQTKLERGNRYSFIFSGESEVLDHYFITPDLEPLLKEATPIHFNSDYPEPVTADTTIHRSSDHDPVFARYALQNLGISKSVIPAANVALGKPVTYTIIVSNTGVAPVTNVIITDTIPAAVAFESWIITGSANLPAGNPITWGPKTLAAGEVATISFRATVTGNNAYAGKTITNTAEYAADGNLSGSDEAAFTIAQLPPVTHTLKYTIVGSGTVALNPTGGVYDEGTVVTMTANALSGWTFEYWSGNIDGGGTSALMNAYVTMTADKTITATFKNAASSIYLPIVMKNYTPPATR